MLPLRGISNLVGALCSERLSAYSRSCAIVVGHAALRRPGEGLLRLDVRRVPKVYSNRLSSELPTRTVGIRNPELDAD